jgi:hypothetical protein
MPNCFKDELPLVMPRSHNVLDEVLVESRRWIANCGWPISASKTDDKHMIVMVHLNFMGGWPAFVKADPSLDTAVIWLLMVRRFGLDFANRIFWCA